MNQPHEHGSDAAAALADRPPAPRAPAENGAAAKRLALRALFGLPLPLFCAAGALLTACVVPFDQALYSAARRALAPGTGLHSFVSSMSALGSWPAGGVINLLMLLHPLRWRLLVGYAVPVLLCSLCVHGLKFAVGRARPHHGVGPWQLEIFSHPGAGFDSFPSGHTLYAFVLVALLSVYLPRWKWAFVGLGGLVALARVVCGAHWPSDTLAGAVLGCLVVYAAVRAGGPYWYALPARA